MVWCYYLIVGILCLATILPYIFLKNKIGEKKLLYSKIVSLILLAIFFVRFMSGRDSLLYVVGLNSSLFSNSFFTFVAMLSNWAMYATIILLVLYPFFNIAFLDRLVKWFASFIALLNLVALPLAFVGIEGTGVLNEITFRGVLMSIELAIVIFYCVFVWLNNYSLKTNWKNVGWFVLCVFAMMLASMPAYAPQVIIGDLNPTWVVDDFSLWHRLFLYFMFIAPVAIYFVVRKKERSVIKFTLLFLAVAQLFVYMCSKKFAELANPLTWPLHLCNTAMYIIVLCLVFKMEKLFYFTYFINVLGAFMALALPEASGNITSYGIFHFWLAHYIAFFLPILCVALKVFPRPKLKHFLYSCLAFTVYFVLIAFINAWFSNYGTVDYFYINSDFIASKLGTWAENLRNVTVTFKIKNLTFVLYPLYQFLFWLVYMVISAGMWFLYEQSYVFVDFLRDQSARKQKIKLDELALKEKLNGREVTEPVNEQNKNKMILRKFTKRYGNSEVYAVKNADLEVVGGEIFGFLGPNGAGKSSIIKTIVGIQPITSGEIEVCGYDVLTQGVMARSQIGFVPDHYALYEKLTGREYINYIADLYRVSEKDRNERIEKYVTIFELKDAFDNQMKTYSHGMKQKIAIMAALVHNPKVWILDEPLTGLDPNSIYQVKECMKNHAKEGNIVFFSSHIIDVVEKICDRIGIIQKGQIQTVKTLSEIAETGKTLEEFYMDTISGDVQPIKVSKEEVEKTNLEQKQ